MKGIANHRRIEILREIEKSKNITLGEIAERLNGNMKTISEHTRRLVQAGLVNKRYQGLSVTHTLSPYGVRVLKFLNTF